MDKNNIILRLNKCKEDLISYNNSLSIDEFHFKLQSNKWNSAEQIYHLITSVKSSILPYKLPTFILRLLFGAVQKKSYSLEELEQVYLSKLDQGAKASGAYAQVNKATLIDKKILLQNFNKQYDEFISAIKNCSEEKLDHCQIPHPILKKITLRELVYFTIFHTEHHLDTIKKTLNKNK